LNNLITEPKSGLIYSQRDPVEEYLMGLVYVRFKAASNSEAVDKFRAYLSESLPGFLPVSELGSLYRVDCMLYEIDLDQPSQEILRLSRRQEIEGLLTMQVPTVDRVQQALNDFADFLRPALQHKKFSGDQKTREATTKVQEAGEVICMIAELLSLNDAIPSWIDIEEHSLESWIYNAPHFPCLPHIRASKSTGVQSLYIGELHVEEP
jgi:hypothetical protein